MNIIAIFLNKFLQAFTNLRQHDITNKITEITKRNNIIINRTLWLSQLEFCHYNFCDLCFIPRLCFKLHSNISRFFHQTNITVQNIYIRSENGWGLLTVRRFCSSQKRECVAVSNQSGLTSQTGLKRRLASRLGIGMPNTSRRIPLSKNSGSVRNSGFPKISEVPWMKENRIFF